MGLFEVVAVTGGVGIESSNSRISAYTSLDHIHILTCKVFKWEAPLQPYSWSNKEHVVIVPMSSISGELRVD